MHASDIVQPDHQATHHQRSFMLPVLIIDLPCRFLFYHVGYKIVLFVIVYDKLYQPSSFRSDTGNPEVKQALQNTDNENSRFSD